MHYLDANDAPNVFRSRQREDEAGKEDGWAGPLKLTSLAKIKIRAAKLNKECDGEDHIQRREHHLLHHAFNLRSGLLPCLLHSARHIAAPANAQRFNGKTPCSANGQCADCTSPDCICAQMVVTRFCKVPGRIKVVLVGEELGL